MTSSKAVIPCSVSELTISLTRGRNSWDWHFITWLSQDQATQLSRELNKGCSSLPEASSWLKGLLHPAIFSSNRTYLVGNLSCQL